jgi:hypothetical protein
VSRVLFAGDEVLKAVVNKQFYILGCNVVLCVESQLTVGEICRLYLQSRTISQARNQHRTSCRMLLRNVCLLLSGLHSVIYQQTESFGVLSFKLLE